MARRESLFGVGVYDLVQASHLLGVSESTIRSWSQPTSKGNDALVPATHGWAFSFHDLLSLAVVAVFYQRGAKRFGVLETIRQLEQRFPEHPRPLAHSEVVDALRTVGQSVVLPDEQVDLAAGGQGILVSTVEQYLLPIEYGPDGLAALWRPADGVLVDPNVQVGHPCIEGTRITTETVAGRAAQGEPLELIAQDLRVGLDAVVAAVAFEASLDTGHGLAQVA